MKKKQKKARTIMEKHGFKDEDLETSKHDEILTWLLDKKNTKKVLLDVGLLKRKRGSIYLTCPHRKDFGVGSKCDWDFKKGSAPVLAPITRRKQGRDQRKRERLMKKLKGKTPKRKLGSTSRRNSP